MTEQAYKEAVDTLRDADCSWSDRLCAALEMMLHVVGDDPAYAEIRGLVSDYNSVDRADYWD